MPADLFCHDNREVDTGMWLDPILINNTAVQYILIKPVNSTLGLELALLQDSEVQVPPVRAQRLFTETPFFPMYSKTNMQDDAKT